MSSTSNPSVLEELVLSGDDNREGNESSHRITDSNPFESRWTSDCSRPQGDEGNNESAKIFG